MAVYRDMSQAQMASGRMGAQMIGAQRGLRPQMARMQGGGGGMAGMQGYGWNARWWYGRKNGRWRRGPCSSKD